MNAYTQKNYQPQRSWLEVSREQLREAELLARRHEEQFKIVMSQDQKHIESIKQRIAELTGENKQ